jgi:hypothetical protein
MPLSAYYESVILKSLFSNTAFPSVATLYLGITTQTVAGAADATLLSGEPPSTNGYARIAVTNNATDFPAPTGSTPTTTKWTAGPGPTGVGSFPVSTGTWLAGAAFYTGFFADAATLGAGHVLWYGALAPAGVTVNQAGITLYFVTNTVQFLLL